MTTPLFLAALAVTYLVWITAARAPAETAEVPASRPAPNWLATCTNTAADGALNCEIAQSIVIEATGARVLTVAIRTAPGGTPPSMMVTLPHGLFLPAGVRMSIDGEAREPLDVQTCDAEGCYVSLPIDEALLTALLRGETLRFTLQDLQRRDIELTVTLAGLAAAYERALR